MAKSGNGIPDNVMQLLAAADARQGFPKGTMASVMQQEVGGNFGKYLNDPAAYHYGLNKEGKRIAGHTGKVSTAFGPFGILESTGAQPGYGVAPLKSKDMGEQIRFASEYLGARSKRAGGLKEGLAGYGEGGKYSEQVAGRVNGWGREAREPVVVAETTAPAQPVVQEAPVMTASAPASVAQGATAGGPQPGAAQASIAPDTWQEFLALAGRPAPAAEATPMNYGAQAMPQVNVMAPDFMAALSGLGGGARPNFQSLRGFGAMGARA